MTWFGVGYGRTYLREVVAKGNRARGYHPLDAALGLLADRASPNILSIVVRLATRISFSDACEMLRWFLPVAPSTEVVEAALLGYGRHTRAWFEDAPAPDDDGTVLIIHADSKGVPTAKPQELKKRRGKRSRRRKPSSPRHRGGGTRPLATGGGLMRDDLHPSDTNSGGVGHKKCVVHLTSLGQVCEYSTNLPQRDLRSCHRNVVSLQ